MKSLSIAALVLSGVLLASCANTIHGVARDTKETGLAFQNGTTSVLKAGSTKKH